jgi:putative redox protein
LQIIATGERAEAHPRRYTQIEFIFEVYGHGVKSKDVQRAIELSMTKYCNAVASTNLEIKHSFRIFKDAPHLTG